VLSTVGEFLAAKTAQFHEMQRESDSFRLPMKNKLRNAAKTYATR
jgi:hypothetical protein